MDNLFKIRKDERWFAAVVAVVLALYNAMVVVRYNEMVASTERWFTWKFCKNYELSGFDPFPYSILSYWTPEYNVFRHPLFSILLYPFYLLNNLLTAATGENCALLVMLLPIIAAGFYSMIFLRRIFEELVGVSRACSLLLTLMTFSFAYVMLAMVAPDHYVFSMFLLIFTLYVVGKHQVCRKPLGRFQTGLLYLLTAGVTLTNGLKTLLATLLLNRRKMFSWRFLLTAVIIPTLLMGALAVYQEEAFVKPREEQKQKAEILRLKHTKKKPRVITSRNGESVSELPLLRWTDITTSRTKTAVENLFGESVMFHTDHLLQDIWKKRPIFVGYSYAINYVVEVLLLLMVVWGIIVGRRSLLLLTALGWFSIDMLLHFVLGFTINEIYIMSPHWLFIGTLAIAYWLKNIRSKWAVATVALVTLFLFATNSFLLGYYLLS
ncbi:MAG: hypothetical protein IJK46_10740 [Prevotella sp.]|nr:hypothetical protein [Prevotella sp.]